jgi:hypothetical protein
MMRSFRSAACALGVVVLVLSLRAAAWAGGSFALEDIKPLLEQEPVLAKWLTDGLDLDETGSATRIGQNVNAHLGGTRVGPYVLLAKPKGVAGPFTLEVTVETEISFLNAAGKSVDLPKARQILEKMSSITVRAYKEGQP